MKRAYLETIIENIEPYTFRSFVILCFPYRPNIHMEDPRVKKIVNDFLSLHMNHIPRGCQYYRQICPFCDIITREQTDIHYNLLEDLFRPVVQETWIRWNRGAYRIADTLDNSEQLLGELVWTVFNRWLQPRYCEILGMNEEEIVKHPYVRQKIHPNK